MKHQKIRASMAHKCKKCLVDYLVNGQDESQSGSALMGTLIHAGFIPYYEKIIGRRIVYREKALENDYFTGHIDGYIKTEKKLFELKTVNSFKFQKITEPLDSHITQVNIYMQMLNIKKAHIVYLNRDNGEHKAYDVDFTPIIYRATALKAEEAIKLTKLEVNPEEIELDEFEYCDQYCKFKTKTLYQKPEDEKELFEIDEADTLIQLFNERQELYPRYKELETKKKDIEAHIKDILGKRGIKKITDLGLSFSHSERSTVDKDKLQAKYPEIYKEVLKTSITQRLNFPKEYKNE